MAGSVGITVVKWPSCRYPLKSVHAMILRGSRDKPRAMVGAESVIAPSQRNPVPVRDNTVFTVSAGVRVTPRTRGVFAVLTTSLTLVASLKHAQMVSLLPYTKKDQKKIQKIIVE